MNEINVRLGLFADELPRGNCLREHCVYSIREAVYLRIAQRQQPSTLCGEMLCPKLKTITISTKYNLNGIGLTRALLLNTPYASIANKKVLI
jgi:hypothetical protein